MPRTAATPASIPVPPPGVKPWYFAALEKPVSKPGRHDENAFYLPLDHSRSVYFRDKPNAADDDFAYGVGTRGRMWHGEGPIAALVDTFSAGLAASNIHSIPSLPVTPDTRLYKETPPGHLGVMVGYPDRTMTLHVFPLGKLPTPVQAVASALQGFRLATDKLPPDFTYDDRGRKPQPQPKPGAAA